MNFISSEYALLLGATVLLCLAFRGRAATWVLLAASFIFYSWWNPPYVALLLAKVTVGWLGGLALARYRSRLTLWLVVVTELSLLVYYKYAAFLLHNLDAVARTMGSHVTLSAEGILLPAGISFMTFQAIGYSIDVYRGERPERSFISTALFLSFFPQLVAGPIERAAHLLPQLKRIENGWRERADWPRGIFMILKGVFFKFVIADNLSVLVNGVYGNVSGASPADVAAAVLGFSIQIYCDFYGYTLIALGSAWLFGIELIQNFTHPYLATNIQDFWRRWHISLSAWFRHYLYVPLGGNRVVAPRHALNLLIVMLVVGLWHGASWMFVIWGAVHGVMLALHALWSRAIGSRPRTGAVGASLGTLTTFALVTLAWIPFRAPDLQVCLSIFEKLGQFVLAPASFPLQVYGASYYAMIAAVFVVAEAADAFLRVDDVFVGLPSLAQASIVVALCTATYLAPAIDVSFIYFQF